MRRVLISSDRPMLTASLADLLNQHPGIRVLTQTMSLQQDTEALAATLSTLRPDVHLVVLHDEKSLPTLKARAWQFRSLVVGLPPMHHEPLARATTRYALKKWIWIDLAMAKHRDLLTAALDDACDAYASQLDDSASILVTEQRDTAAPIPRRQTAVRTDVPAAAPTLAAFRAQDYKSLKPRAVVMGASAGGPAAVARLLSQLPGNFSMPILLAQHMSTGFGEQFSSWLEQQTRRSVRLARGNERLAPGVYLAPDNHHIECGGNFCVRLSPAHPRDHAVPSVDRLFHSAQAQLGDQAIGIVLTGMGDDGAGGLLAMRKSGALTFVQEETSCLVNGMPRAAAQAGAAAHSGTPEEIAHALMELDARAVVPRKP